MPRPRRRSAPGMAVRAHALVERPTAVVAKRPTVDAMRIAVVVPSYNGRALLERTLVTLEQVLSEGPRPVEAEVVVVDGRSRDGSFEMVQQKFPWVTAVSCENHGFGHAINRGLERTTAEYVLLLNSDLYLTRAAMDSMYARLERHRDLGAVQPLLLNEDGTRQKVFGAFGVIYTPNWRDVNVPTSVPIVSFACAMTRRDVLQRVGALDENFFLYNEEYDWCLRARRAGFSLEVVPETVVHVGHGSTSPSPDLVLEAQRGFLYFAHKHGPRFVAEGLRLAMQFEGYCYSRIDPRPQYRSMWAKLEALTTKHDLLDSPFRLSGRGDSPAQPREGSEPEERAELSLVAS